MDAAEFVRSLSAAKPQSGMFNPFSDVCPDHDLPNADKIRCHNLETFLKAQLELKPSYLWVGEAPAYAGSRRSGIFFVSEVNFKELQQITKSGSYKIATRTGPKASNTQKIMWDILKTLPEFPMTFDALPFHPFNEGNSLSNRTPTKGEIVRNLGYLDILVKWFAPEKVVAIGKNAQSALSKLGVDSDYVRHPSYGGKGAFIDGIRRIYGLG